MRLFHRTTHSSTLTEERRRLMASFKPSLDGVLGALNRARSAARDDEGLIRITGNGAKWREFFVPCWPSFSGPICPLNQGEMLLN